MCGTFLICSSSKHLPESPLDVDVSVITISIPSSGLLSETSRARWYGWSTFRARRSRGFTLTGGISGCQLQALSTFFIQGFLFVDIIFIGSNIKGAALNGSFRGFPDKIEIGHDHGISFTELLSTSVRVSSAHRILQIL